MRLVHIGCKLKGLVHCGGNWRALLALMLPSITTLLVQSLNTSINVVWLGRLAGSGALAAVANVNVVLLLLTSLGYGVAMAAATLSGQARGRGDHSAVAAVVVQALGFTVIINTVVAIALSIEGRPVLRLLGTPIGSLTAAVSYLRIAILGLPISAITVVLIAAMRATGAPYQAAAALLITSLVDLACTPVFMTGFGPLHAMGINGAAYSTLVAAIAGLAFLYLQAFGLNVRRGIIIIGSAYKRKSYSFTSFLARKGLSIGLQNVVQASSAMAMLGLINKRGATTVAAFAINNQIWGLMQIPSIALSSAAGVLIAQQLGRDDNPRIGRDVISYAVVNLLMSALVICIVLITGRQIIHLMTGSAGEIVDVAQHMSQIVTIGFMIYSVTSVMASAMRAGGAVGAYLLISITTSFPVRLILATYGSRVAGPEALWISYPLSSGMAMIATYLVFKKGLWRVRIN